MRKISFFGEDEGHRVFLVPLIKRIASEYDVPVAVREYSVRGGFGKVENELGEYVRDLLRFEEDLPDLVVVATDANCSGFRKRRQKLEEAAERIKDRVVYAVPDPHIERWMLIDAAAFNAVLGNPCSAPDQKCGRDRYKMLLSQAVRDAGVTPLLGGMEHAEDIVREMDLKHAGKGDDLRDLLQQLQARFRLWSQD